MTVSPTEQLSFQVLCCVTLIPVNKCLPISDQQQVVVWIPPKSNLVNQYDQSNDRNMDEGLLRDVKILQSVCITEAYLSKNDSSQK